MKYLIMTILLWSTLAVLAVQVKSLPSLFTLGVSITIGSIYGFLFFKKLNTSIKAVIISTTSYFLYHFFLYESFKHAPVIEANTIQYLWPLLIIVIGTFLTPQEKFNKNFFISLSGSIFALFFIGRNFISSFNTSEGHLYGYSLAFLAAVTWSLFSVISKQDSNFNGKSVSIGCFSAGILSLLSSFFYNEVNFTSITFKESATLIVIGLGPFGLAFYFWDKATKIISTRIIGISSLTIPILSNVFLFIFTGERIKNDFLIAGVIITLTPAISYLLKQKQEIKPTQP
jgi:drug/metabolite transporter (DMT)-like permease